VVSSFLPAKGFGVPSLAGKATSRHVDPRASVGSYVNQQLAGLIAGTSPTVGPSSKTDTLDPNAGQDMDLSPIQQRIRGVGSQIKESNDRIKLYQETARARRASGSATGRTGSPFSVVGAGQGFNYQNNGKLSKQRNQALQLASSYVGNTPYQFGGTSRRGIDCSGLVMMVYNQMGFNITQHSAGWQGRNIPGVRTSIRNLRPGDIVAWRDGSHIAIYAGNGNIIEAAKPGTMVRVKKLWSSAVYGIALRFPGE